MYGKSGVGGVALGAGAVAGLPGTGTSAGLLVFVALVSIVSGLLLLRVGCRRSAKVR